MPTEFEFDVSLTGPRYAYAVTNLLTGLAAGDFTFSAGANDSTRSRLNDARMDKRYVNGSPTAALTLVIDLGSSRQTSGIAILNHNLGTAALAPTVRIRGATDAAITTSVVTAKAASALNTSAPYQKDHVLQYTAITKRYLEVLISFTGTATGLAIGELWAFDAQTVLSRRSIYGGGEEEEIKSAQVDFYNGGARSSFLGGPLRSLTLPFADLTLSQRREMATMWRATRGPVTPFLFIESYEATATAAAEAEQACIYGKMLNGVFTWKENDFLLYTPDDLLIRSLSREAGA